MKAAASSVQLTRISQKKTFFIFFMNGGQRIKVLVAGGTIKTIRNSDRFFLAIEKTETESQFLGGGRGG